jgi:hypothetical protein
MSETSLWSRDGVSFALAASMKEIVVRIEEKGIMIIEEKRDGIM